MENINNGTREQQTENQRNILKNQLTQSSSLYSSAVWFIQEGQKHILYILVSCLKPIPMPGEWHVSGNRQTLGNIKHCVPEAQLTKDHSSHVFSHLQINQNSDLSGPFKRCIDYHVFFLLLNGQNKLGPNQFCKQIHFFANGESVTRDLKCVH